MMKDDEPLIICQFPEYEKYIKKSFRKQYPSKNYKVGEKRRNHKYTTRIVTQLKYDLQERQFNKQVNFSKTAIVQGDQIR